MSRSIAESISLLSETLGNCKTNLKEKSVEDVDNIKISDVDEKIAEIQAGGSGKEPEYVFGACGYLQNFIGTNYSTLEKHKCFIVNDKAPADTQTTDISKDRDNSVVVWIKDNDMYISSQSDALICFNEVLGLFSKSTFVGGGNYVYDCPFSEIYCDNLSTIITLNYSSMFLNGNYLTTVDISNFNFSLSRPTYGSSFNLDGLFDYCQSLTTIYSEPWNFEDTNDPNIFSNCSSLPNYSSSKTGIDMCKYKEDGGYFTNPAERVK